MKQITRVTILLYNYLTNGKSYGKSAMVESEVHFRSLRKIEKSDY